jgi:hypothetical protein
VAEWCGVGILGCGKTGAGYDGSAFEKKWRVVDQHGAAEKMSRK